MKDQVKPRVNVSIEIIDAKTGELIKKNETHNLVVDTGLNLLRDALYTGTISPLTRIGLGTSGSAVLPTDTQLGSELFKTNLLSVTSSNKILTCQYFLDENTANGQLIREFGLFTTGGTLYARVTQDPPIEKTELVVAALTWTLDWGAA